MTKDEYGLMLDRIGISNRNFCMEVVGVDERTGRDWKSGDARVPGSVAALLRLAIRLKLKAEKLRELTAPFAGTRG